MTKRKEQQPKYKQSETVVIKRSQINFAPYNPRKEDPEVIKKLKKNFKTVGYLGGIVWNQLSSYYNRGIQMYRFPNSDVQKSVIFEGIKKRLKIV